MNSAASSSALLLGVVPSEADLSPIRRAPLQASLLGFPLSFLALALALVLALDIVYVVGLRPIRAPVLAPPWVLHALSGRGDRQRRAEVPLTNIWVLGHRLQRRHEVHALVNLIDRLLPHLVLIVDD